jgi:drug/metabolite transporter (DMT)-like permease
VDVHQCDPCIVPADAFLLALGVAALHAGWNILVARAEDVRAATTVALCLSVILFAPAAATTWDVDASAMPWIVLSAALELAYFVLLTAAYRKSDVSLVYPISRGVAPVLVLAGGWLAGARLGALAAVGVVLVGAGVLLVRGVTGPADRRGVLLALSIAGTIAGYTLADNEAIEHASAIAYLELVLAPVAIVALLAHATTGRLASLRQEVGLATMAAALGSFGAYALVLAALELAPAASVAAVRETSVLFAVALGAIVLHERVMVFRAVGAALVVAGVAVVATA